MKKLVALWLTAALLLSLAGCVQKDAKPTAPSTQPSPPVKLTVAVPANGVDYENNGFTLWLEEQTGCELEFLTFQTGGDYKFAFDPLLEAEELPDILWNFQADPEKWAQYGAEGILLELSPYYNDREGKAKVFWDRLAELPEEQQTYVAHALTAEDGGMYALPTLEYSMTGTMEYQVFINRDWLDTLELEMPRDPQSFRAVLEAFRDGDPNGNGKKDEIPLLGSMAADSGDIVLWILNMFTTCSHSRPFCVDENDRVYLPYTEDAYRQALIYIHGLIADGLMFPSAFSMGSKDMASLLNPPEGEPVTVGVWAGDPKTVPEEGNGAILSYDGLPYWGNAVRTDPVLSTRVYISADCRNPDAAWDLLMLMCSEEGTLRMRYGVKDTDWIPSDEVSYIGTKVKAEIQNSDALQAAWGDVQGAVCVEPETTLQYDEARSSWAEAQVGLMTAGYFCFIDAEGAGLLPRLAVSDSDSAAACRKLIATAMEEFCCGTGTYNDPRDDRQWSAYLAELQELGLDSWQNAYKEAYRLQYPN